MRQLQCWMQLLIQETYSNLADNATDALGQLLPKQFRGAGFQNVPTNALNVLDDLTNLPAGPIKDMAQRRAAQEFAKKAGSGTVRVPVIPTGGQRVVVGDPSRYTILDDVARSSLKTPGALNNLRGLLGKGAYPIAGGVIDAGLRINDGQDPTDAVGRAVFGTGWLSFRYGWLWCARTSHRPWCTCFSCSWWWCWLWRRHSFFMTMLSNLALWTISKTLNSSEECQALLH